MTTEQMTDAQALAPFKALAADDPSPEMTAALAHIVARLRGDAHSPSYEAFQLIAQSVCGALDRAGITECDDPGEAIDVMRGRLEARIAALEAQRAEQQAGVPRPMDTAPRDGTMVRLLVEFEEHQTVDDSTGTAWTIGANTNDLDSDQPAEWQFAGWCWTHDHFTEGKGTPIGWLPLGDDAQPAPSAETPVMTFSLGEAVALVQTFRGANCSMSVQEWDATPRAGDEDPPRAGKYAWCTDYPEEGASWLGEHDPSSEAHEGWNAKPPAISVQVAASVAVPDDGLFYIQDSRSYVGNCPLWWGPDGKGYVTRLDEAGRYTREAAVRQHRARETDVPWPCAEIDALVRGTVDVQHMRPVSQQTAMLAAAPVAPEREVG